MLCSGNAAGNSKQISRPEDSHQYDTLPASTSEDVEEETAAVVVQAAAVTAEQAEEPDQSASPETTRIEVAHRAYRNTRVSVTEASSGPGSRTLCH